MTRPPAVAIGLVALVYSLIQAQVPPTVTKDEVRQLTSKASAGDSTAQLHLGLALASGNGVPQDESKALVWFRRAAEQGNADAEYALGEMLLMGRGATADASEAFQWMKRAALHNQGYAQANLGVLYLDGTGTRADVANALYWLEKAAAQNVAAGQFGLGSLYANGRGVTKDLAKAKYWYSLAADQGDPQARNNLAHLLASAPDPAIRDVDRAIRIAQDLAATFDTVAPFHDTLATSLFAGGRINDAIIAEEKALKLDPSNSGYEKALARFREAFKSLKSK